MPVMSPSLMAKSIIRLSQNPDLMREMGENGCARVVKYYQEEDFLKAYRDLYERVKREWQESDLN